MNYFGTDTRDCGHYWWAEGMKCIGQASSVNAPIIFRREEPCPMGARDWQWSLCYIDGHTILMCWGSVRDKRPKSVTCFVEKAQLVRAEMADRIEAAFPEIWNALPVKP